MRAFRVRAEQMLWPLAGILGFVALWHVLTATGAVPRFLLPSPGRVLAALWELIRDGSLWRHLDATLRATALGYLAGAAGAAALAALIAEFRSAERLLMLHLYAIQSIPKVSIAPLVFLWAGFDIEGKVVLVALICFFPVFANALAGFRAADPNLIDLMRAAGASRWRRFTQVKLPTALPHIFSGLEVAVAFALIGCIVMEFVGATRGLGFMIQDSANTFDLPRTFAVVILLGLIGVAGNQLVKAVHRRAVFWEPKPRGGEADG